MEFPETLEKPVFRDQAIEDKIIDLDFHLHIPYVKLLPYIGDSKVKKTLERSGPPPDRSRPMVRGYGSPKTTVENYDRTHGVAANREEIREVSDELAIDIPLVQAGTSLPLVRNNYPVITNALVKAYNDYIIDRVVDVKNDVLASMFIPHWDVPFALDEIERVGSESGIAAAQTWLETHKPWGHPDYDPIFEALTDRDLNLILHIANGSSIWDTAVDQSSRTYGGNQAIALSNSAKINAASMVMTGVFEIFPELEVSIQEAGTLWLPCAAYILDERYISFPKDSWMAERLYESGRDLTKLPSEYMFENVRVATQPQEFSNIPRSDHVEGLLKGCRAGETFQYTSDWPHSTLDPMEWLYDFPHIDDEMREDILYNNSAEFLRMP